MGAFATVAVVVPWAGGDTPVFSAEGLVQLLPQATVRRSRTVRLRRRHQGRLLRFSVRRRRRSRCWRFVLYAWQEMYLRHRLCSRLLVRGSEDVPGVLLRAAATSAKGSFRWRGRRPLRRGRRRSRHHRCRSGVCSCDGCCGCCGCCRVCLARRFWRQFLCVRQRLNTGVA